MKNVLILILFFFSASKVYNQTLLDSRVEYFKQRQEKQNDRISNIEINPLKLKKLEQLGYDVSKFDFNNFEEKKQVVLLFRKETSKTEQH